MKYIRTGNGIYRISKVLKDGMLLIKGRFHISKDNDCKQADTIEELCDEFVTSYIDGFHQLTSFPSKVEVVLGHSVYGAIWTDKGLIYVAKMNDKGELELI